VTRLFHYTCGHGRKGLGELGLVTPVAQLTPEAVVDPAENAVLWWLQHRVWFTDMETPNRNALGLTQNYSRCDRTRWRYRLTVKPEETGLKPWVDVRRDVSPYIRELLEHSPGARPRHWWVAYDQTVPVVYDRRNTDA